MVAPTKIVKGFLLQDFLFLKGLGRGRLIFEEGLYFWLLLIAGFLVSALEVHFKLGSLFHNLFNTILRFQWEVGNDACKQHESKQHGGTTF